MTLVTKDPKASALERFTLSDIPIFSVGTHTDSQGASDTWTLDDLNKMAEAFCNGVPPIVPIKLGHVTDEFVAQVSAVLELPKEVLQGEGPTGTGAAKLGEIVGLQVRDNTLFAVIEAANVKVHSLYTDGYFTGVSSEIQRTREQDGKTWGPVLSGLALLGAQRSALGDLNHVLSSEPTPYYVSDQVPDFIIQRNFGSVSDLKFGLWDFLKSNLPPDRSKDPPAQRRTVEEKVPMSQLWGDIPPKKGAFTWQVPITELTTGRNIQATVSAPNEITARSIALRGLESIIQNAAGPIGTILGVIGAIAIGNRFLTRMPTALRMGVIGQAVFRMSSGGPETRHSEITTNYVLPSKPVTNYSSSLANYALPGLRSVQPISGAIKSVGRKARSLFKKKPLYRTTRLPLTASKLTYKYVPPKKKAKKGLIAWGFRKAGKHRGGLIATASVASSVAAQQRGSSNDNYSSELHTQGYSFNRRKPAIIVGGVGLTLKVGTTGVGLYKLRNSASRTKTKRQVNSSLNRVLGSRGPRFGAIEDRDKFGNMTLDVSRGPRFKTSEGVIGHDYTLSKDLDTAEGRRKTN